MSAFGWAVAATLALGTVGGLWLSAQVLRRIDSMRLSAQRLMAGDWSRRIPLSPVDDDLTALARTFNRLFDRIENPFGDEIRPGGRTDALWALRRQRRLVGADDPGVQSKRRDEASRAGREMGGQTHEGAALPSDRPARTGGQPRPPADHSSGRRGRSAGHPPRRPPKDPGAGAGTGRMSPYRALPSVDLISRSVPWRGDDAPRPRQASPTRPGCTQSSPDSPCVSRTRHACRRTSGGDRPLGIVTLGPVNDRKIGHAPARAVICSGIVEGRVNCNSWRGLLLSDPRGRFVSMPRDEPSFIVAPGECDELGAQFLDGFERPHPEQVLLQGSDEVRIPRQSGRGFRFDVGHRSDLIPATIPK